MRSAAATWDGTSSSMLSLSFSIAGLIQLDMQAGQKVFWRISGRCVRGWSGAYRLISGDMSRVRRPAASGPTFRAGRGRAGATRRKVVAGMADRPLFAGDWQAVETRFADARYKICPQLFCVDTWFSAQRYTSRRWPTWTMVMVCFTSSMSYNTR
jgi:hypothetical protein